MVLTEGSYYEQLMRHPGKYITPEMRANILSLRLRVAEYTTTMCIVNQFVRENPGLITEAEWHRLEEAIAQKYRLSSISIFRQTIPPQLPNSEE